MSALEKRAGNLVFGCERGPGDGPLWRTAAENSESTAVRPFTLANPGKSYALRYDTTQSDLFFLFGQLSLKVEFL